MKNSSIEKLNYLFITLTYLKKIIYIIYIMVDKIKREIIMDLSDDESNNISDGSEDEYEESDYDNSNKIQQNAFAENVIKYLKTDDIIKLKQKEHRLEMKNLKERKKKSEEHILNYLDRMDENYVNIDNKGKLIKNKSETKSSIKIDNIKDGIIEGLKGVKVIEKLNGNSEIVKKILNLIDSKREVKTRTYLKRTSVRKKNKK